MIPIIIGSIRCLKYNFNSFDLYDSIIPIIVNPIAIITPSGLNNAIAIEIYGVNK